MKTIRTPWKLTSCVIRKLGQIIDRCYRIHGNTETAIMLDYIKDMGYHYSTIAAITISISDMEIPEAKAAIIDESEKLVEKYEKAYKTGAALFLTRSVMKRLLKSGVRQQMT